MIKYFDGNHGKMNRIASAWTSGWTPVLAPCFPRSTQCTHAGPARSTPHVLPTRSTTRGGPLVPRTLSMRIQAGTFCARSVVPQQLQQTTAAGGPIATCVTSNLLLQHPNETLATYVWNSWNTCNVRLKHLQNTQKHLKAIANVYNIQIYFDNI
jgi:hypothetical protein